MAAGDNGEEDDSSSLETSVLYLQEYTSAMSELKKALREKKRKEEEMDSLLKKMQNIRLIN